MQVALYNYIIENKDKLNLTKKQIIILNYILKDANWLKSNIQIAKDLGVSRVTVKTVYDILQAYYEDKL